MDASAPQDIQRLLRRLREEFLQELPNRIDAIERLILEPRAEPEELCRQVHNLKGLGATHGIDVLSFACHQLETHLADAGETANDRTRLLAHVDILRQIQQLGSEAIQQAEPIRQALRALDGNRPGNVLSLLLVEPSASLAGLLQERLADLPLQIDRTDDGLSGLEHYLNRRHAVLVTAGEPRRLGGAALIAAVKHSRQGDMDCHCLLVTGSDGLSHAASGGADRILPRDRELPDRLHAAIARQVEQAAGR